MTSYIYKAALKGKVVFAGVGNILRGDDGFGSLLARSISGRVSFKVFDTGAAPENYLGVIARERPDTIVFADTCDFGGSPGEVNFFRAENVADPSFYLTHNTSLKMLFEFISFESVSADIFVLCVQPDKMGVGEDMSVNVEQALVDLFNWLTLNYAA